MPAAVPYTGLSLDRATGPRADPAWVAALAADPRARVRPLWRDQCLVAGDPPAPLVLPASALDATALDDTALDDTAPDDTAPDDTAPA
jgi:NAD+ diphosphatase